MKRDVAKEAYKKARMSGLDKTKAAKKAKISRRTAYRIEENPEYQSEMRQALEKAGVTTELMAVKLRSLFDAQKVISANIIVKGATADEQDGMKDADGVTKDFIPVDDCAVQLKAVELAGKFRGDFLERLEHSGQVGVVEIVDFAAKKK